MEEEKKIPTAPEELFEKAQPIYDAIYEILHKEQRSKEKYKVTVAIAANALYFYRKAVQMADELGDSVDRSPMEMNRVINGMNKASGEYLRAAKSLQLTPESEGDLKNFTDKKGPTLAEILGQGAPKSKNDSYGSKNKTNKKSSEKKVSTRKKKG